MIQWGRYRSVWSILNKFIINDYFHIFSNLNVDIIALMINIVGMVWYIQYMMLMKWTLQDTIRESMWKTWWTINVRRESLISLFSNNCKIMLKKQQILIKSILQKSCCFYTDLTLLWKMWQTLERWKSCCFDASIILCWKCDTLYVRWMLYFTVFTLKNL